MLLQAPTVSAWTQSSPPALVQGLEAAFLSGLNRGLATSPYLSDETRSGIANLVRREAPIRQIGDALMISYASDWAKRLTRKYGPDDVACDWRGADRLFEPLPGDAPFVPPPDFDVKKSRFLSDFSHLNLMSRAILEVRFPADALCDLAPELLFGGLCFLDVALRPLGFFVYSHPEKGMPEQATVRFFSLTALELGLYVFLGTQAPRFCLGPGVSPPSTLNAVHKTAYHLVGAPTHRWKAHGVRMPPLSLIWHDIAHGAHWAFYESPSERMAATLLYESAMKTLNGSRRTEPVAARITQIIDLELGMNGGVFGILSGLKAALPPRRFGALASDYTARLRMMEDSRNGAYCADLANRLRAL